jgi:hypothetical protein
MSSDTLLLSASPPADVLSTKRRNFQVRRL